jgi:hypothetical protein
MSDDQRFIDNGDGTISDTKTDLMWKKNDSYNDLLKFLNYGQGKKYMKKTNEDSFAGHSDWRIPAKNEAQTLFYYDLSKSMQDKYNMILYIDPVFPEGCGYNTWTTETRGKITAYIFSFAEGTGQHNEVDITVSTSLRLVRGTLNPEVAANLGKIPKTKMDPAGGAGWK